MRVFRKKLVGYPKPAMRSTVSKTINTIKGTKTHATPRNAHSRRRESTGLLPAGGGVFGDLRPGFLILDTQGIYHDVILEKTKILPMGPARAHLGTTTGARLCPKVQPQQLRMPKVAELSLIAWPRRIAAAGAPHTAAVRFRELLVVGSRCARLPLNPSIAW